MEDVSALAGSVCIGLIIALFPADAAAAVLRQSRYMKVIFEISLLFLQRIYSEGYVKYIFKLTLIERDND